MMSTSSFKQTKTSFYYSFQFEIKVYLNITFRKMKCSINAHKQSCKGRVEQEKQTKLTFSPPLCTSGVSTVGSQSKPHLKVLQRTPNTRMTLFRWKYTVRNVSEDILKRRQRGVTAELNTNAFNILHQKVMSCANEGTKTLECWDFTTKKCLFCQ